MSDKMRSDFKALIFLPLIIFLILAIRKLTHYWSQISITQKYIVLLLFAQERGHCALHLSLLAYCIPDSLYSINKFKDIIDRELFHPIWFQELCPEISWAKLKHMLQISSSWQ